MRRVCLVFGVWVFLLFVAAFGAVLKVPLVNGSFTASSKGFESQKLNMPLYNDTRTDTDLPFFPGYVLSSSSSPSPGYSETSEYLIGSVAVGVIFLESNGAIDPQTENWTSERESQVVNEISSGLSWLANYNPDAHVSFVYDIHYQVPTSYEPIAHTSTWYEKYWIGEAMTYLGYPGSSYKTQVRDYVNALRDSLGTDWAFAIFVVDSYNDANGQFAGGDFAYAYLGGTFLVMTYKNDAWGIENMDNVVAHETLHIFYATDEYEKPNEYSGYLNVPDNDGAYCIMNANIPIWTICPATQGQIGWRDTDGDKIQDIVDTFPDTVLNPYSPDPTNTTILTYNGTVTEIPYPNNNPHGTSRDVTINTITQVQFRIDSSAWINASATDGIFDEAAEEFTFFTSSLSLGTHTIEARGINSVGNVETSYSSDTVTIDFIPPTTFDDYDRSWKTKNFNINLTATDNLNGVAKISYKINNGPIKIVSVNGQPLITTEGANNTLEYWSVDSAGNEEGHHILTEIKLDKTTPKGTVIINNGAVYTSSAPVTLTLTATDATSGVYQVRYSNDGVWDTEPWETPLPTKEWTLMLEDGTKTVYYQVKDSAGLTSPIYQDTITLDTTKPTANAGNNRTVNEDTQVAFDGSASTDKNGISTYTWAFTDVTPQTLSGKRPTYTFGTPGTYTITLEVTDPAGNTATATVIITVLDVTRPKANAGSDQTVNEDTLVTFDASGSSDNVGIVDYTWTFTEADTLKTLDGKNPSYTFQTPGVYTVTLNVTDAAGNYATGTVTAIVRDITNPAANAGSDGTFNEDTPITLDGSTSSDNVGITAYKWAFTDVTTKTLTGPKPTYTFTTPGVYTLTLNVTDAAGNWATDALVITVLDITKPVANAGQDQTGKVGASVTFDAGASSDNVDIVSYEWNFGDGTTGTGKTTTHTYTSPGTYTVTLTVKDTAGNSATVSKTVTVLAPEAFPIWIVGAAIALIGIAVATTILVKKRK